MSKIYSHKFQLKVLEYAKVHGNKKAGIKFNIGTTTIWRWKNEIGMQSVNGYINKDNFLNGYWDRFSDSELRIILDKIQSVNKTIIKKDNETRNK